MSDKLAVIKNQLEQVRPTFEQLNLTGLSFAKELEFAVQALNKNTYLQGATQDSITNALKNIALSGLSLNPVLKYCYLIPRKERQVLQCIAEPSYMGLIKILTDTGSVVAISATIVYQKEIDSLVIQEGAGGHATHKHHFGKEKPGEPVACYSIAILPNGMKHVSLIREWQWEDIMKRSEAVKSYYAKQAKGEYAAIPTWMSDKEEMIRKTAIKNHYKYLPKSERAEQIGHAIALDDEANGINFEGESKEAAQQSAKEKAQTLNIDLLDPNNPEHVEKWNGLLALFQDKSLPAKWTTHKGAEFDKKATGMAMYEEFQAGTLTIAKANKTVEYLKQVIEHFKSQQKTEE